MLGRRYKQDNGKKVYMGLDEPPPTLKMHHWGVNSFVTTQRSLKTAVDRKFPNEEAQIQTQLPVLRSSHPGGGSAVVVDEERPSIWGNPHLPARGQEALLRLVLRLRWAIRRWLRGLWVGEGVFHRPPHLDVVGALQQVWEGGRGVWGGRRKSRSTDWD